MGEMTIFEKLERISELKGEISQLRNKIDNINRLIRDLEDNSTCISDSCNSWIETKTSYTAILLSPSIFYTSEFEGDIAEAFHDTIPQKIKTIQGNCNTMLKVKAAISDQVGLLQKNVSALNDEIEILQSEIDSLGFW